MMQSFAMYLIDKGKADACAIGWVNQWMNKASHEEYLDATEDVVRQIKVPEYVYTSGYYPSGVHRVLAWIYPDDWTVWCAMVRMTN